MVRQFHGLTQNESSGQLRFGIKELFASVCNYTYPPAFLPATSTNLPDWHEHWFTPQYSANYQKFNDLFWKTERAASLFGRSQESWKSNFEAGNASGISIFDPAFLAYMSAIEDMPLYLDLLLLYLRSQLDILSSLLRHFYGKKNGARIPTGFRDHVRWFNRGPGKELDPKYSDVLSADLGWFDKLSAKGNLGLREARVHGEDVYQLSYSASDMRFGSVSMSSGRWTSSDVVEDMKLVMAGYCLYLDRALDHLLDDLVPLEFADWFRKADRVTLTIEGGPLPSAWLYPVI